MQLSRENGGWVVTARDGTKYIGASWTTLLKVAEKLGEERVITNG
jgi:hypothetical protein